MNCEICHRTLKSEKFLKRHILAKHPNTPRHFTCDYDGRTFLLKDYLRIHLDRHRKYQIYTCETCLKSYVSRHTFRRHLKMHIEKHKCNECGQTFGTKINLDSHVASKHKDELTVPCNYCTRLFCSKTARNNHQYMSHKNKSKDELSFKCHQCNIYFEMKEELRIHSFIHFEGEIKSCPECDQIFKTTRLLNVHMQKHQTKKTFQCTDCGDFFTFKTGLAKHIRLNRCKGPADDPPDLKNVEDVAKTQLASITKRKPSRKVRKAVEKVLSNKPKFIEIPQLAECQEEVKPQTRQKVKEKEIQLPAPDVALKETRKLRKQNFVIHSRLGRAHLTYICDICGEEVKYMKGIKEHMKSHVLQEKLPCKICSEDFKSRKSLSEHLLAVHGIKTSVLFENYTCEVCEAKFDVLSRFQSHKLSHDENARTLHCRVCDAAFKTIGNLRRHEATHASSCDFHCEKCPKSFRTKIALNVHCQNVHCEFNVLVECPICHTFVKEKNFNHHTKNQHSEDSKLKPYSCTVCLKSFKTQKLGERHYEACHNPKDRGVVYQCSDCPEQFFRQRHLKDHLLLTHSSGPIFQCDICQRIFKSARLLQIHIHAIHENPGITFACQKCNAVLKTRTGLAKHVKSSHPETTNAVQCIEIETNANM